MTLLLHQVNTLLLDDMHVDLMLLDDMHVDLMLLDDMHVDLMLLDDMHMFKACPLVCRQDPEAAG